KDFGAVGDNSANDTTAIQAAVTAAAGRALYFPAGIYRITGPIVFPNGQYKIYGDGKLSTHIHVDYNGRGFSFEDVNTYGLIIADLHIYGNGNLGAVTSIGIYVASSVEETAHILFSDLRF